MAEVEVEDVVTSVEVVRCVQVVLDVTVVALDVTAVVVVVGVVAVLPNKPNTARVATCTHWKSPGKRDVRVPAIKIEIAPLDTSKVSSIRGSPDSLLK